MRFSSRHAILGCFVVLVCLPSFGCRRIIGGILGKAEESAGISEDGKGTYTFKDPKNPGSTLTLGSKEVPPDFPKNIPLYPGATVIGGATIGDKDTKVTNVGVQTTDSPDKIVAFYKGKYGTADFKDTNDEAQNNPMAGMLRVLTFKDATSGCDVTVTIQSTENGSSVQVAATKSTKKK